MAADEVNGLTAPALKSTVCNREMIDAGAFQGIGVSFGADVGNSNT